MEPNRMCRRIIRLNMAAIHTTTLTMTNTLLDLYGSPSAEDFVAGLREECERVYKAHDNKWSKAAVNELHRVDSCIKESMRLNGIGLQALSRRVIHPDGVDFGDVHIPNNVTVAVTAGAIHRDPEYVFPSACRLLF
jgi:cytochrome P450